MPCREAWCCKREDRNLLILIPRQIYNKIKPKMKVQIAVLNQQPKILWRYSSWQLRFNKSFARVILLHQPKKGETRWQFSLLWLEKVTFFPPDFLPMNIILKMDIFRVQLSLGYSWLPNQKKNQPQTKTKKPTTTT